MNSDISDEFDQVLYEEERKCGYWIGDAGENESIRGSAWVHESLGPMPTHIKDQLVLAGSRPLNKTSSCHIQQNIKINFLP